MDTSEKPVAAATPAPPFSEHLEFLSVMSRDFAIAGNVDKILTTALQRVTDYIGAAGGALFLLNEDDGSLHCQASVGPVDIRGLKIAAGVGIVGRCVAQNRGEIVRDAANDPNFNADVDAETGFTTRSILCAPMTVKDQRIGAIELVNKRGGDQLFSDSDLHMLSALSTAAGLAILNARMAAALIEQERLRHELTMAADIQRNLLPKSGAGAPYVWGVNRPARMVSGDFYDFFTLPDSRVYFALGDVSGKGMEASLLMAKTCSLFHCLGKTLHQPGRLLDLINTEVCETTTRGKFVTMVIGLLDPRTGHIVLANAGHEPPLPQTRHDAFMDFPADMPPLGIAPGIAGADGFPEITLDLDGGALFVFSDGVTEGRLDGGGMFEVAGMKTLLRRLRDAPPADRIAGIVEKLERQGGRLHDDLTVVAITANPAQREISR